MGEDIEIQDANGNLVRVSLHAALMLIGETLQDDSHVRSVTRKDGRRVEVRLAAMDE